MTDSPAEPRAKIGIVRVLLGVPLLYKILIANSLLVFLALVTGVRFISGGVPVFLISSGILLLSIFINFVVVRLALEPTRDLSNTIARIAAGEFNVRANYHPLGERLINQSVEGLNRMLDTLERIIETLEKERERAREQAKLVLLAQEEERKRIARELHDEASQVLATLLLGIGEFSRKVRDKSGQNEGFQEELDRIGALTEEAIAELQRLAFNLRPSILDDMGLKPALTWLLREHLEKKKVRVSFAWTGSDAPLPGEVQIALFRVAQEALINIVKYAKARNVKVTVTQDGGQIDMSIEDDGCGFDPDPPGKDKENRLGIYGMQERISLVSGDFKMDSAPGKGTHIRVSIPLKLSNIREELQ